MCAISPLQKELLEQSNSINSSEKYKVVRTIDVVNMFREHGFEITKIKNSKVNLPEKQGYQPHQVRMALTTNKMEQGLRPEIVINNSYDTTRALSIHIGVYRLVCSNGLVALSDIIQPIKIKHIGSIADEVAAFAATYSDLEVSLMDSVQSIKDQTISDEAIIKLGQRALELRGSNPNDLEAAKEIALSYRDEDNGNGAWEVFNRIQENTLKGRFFFHTTQNQEKQVTVRKAKPISNIAKEQSINVGLWEKVEELIAA